MEKVSRLGTFLFPGSLRTFTTSDDPELIPPKHEVYPSEKENPLT